MGKFFAKSGNWPYYIAKNCTARGPVRTSRIDVEGDVRALGSNYKIVGLLTEQALPLIAADQQMRSLKAA
jgi:hypothetical protein